MPNSYFQFKEFLINQANSGMKVTTDGCVFGAWMAEKLKNSDANCGLDIGVGTGLLSLMVAQKSELEIIGVEFEKGAFEECKQNFQSSLWSDRLLVKNNIIQNFTSEKSFDVIFSNPPYYYQSKRGKSVVKNTAQHADQLSMVDLLAAVVKHLSPDGRFFVMYPEAEFNKFCAAAEETGLLLRSKLEMYNAPDKEVFRVCGEFVYSGNFISSEKLIFREPDGLYSLDFKNLLRDYYLHLD